VHYNEGAFNVILSCSELREQGIKSLYVTQILHSFEFACMAGAFNEEHLTLYYPAMNLKNKG
jgi:hypothetical protein